MSESKFSPDMNNRAHGPHGDLVTRLPTIKGAEQIRVSPSGEVLGGTTNVGKVKINW
jgi:hypothetical protein